VSRSELSAPRAPMSQPPPETTEPAGNDSLAGASRLKRLLRPVMNLVALVFVVVAAVDMARRWDQTKVELEVLPALAACLPLLCAGLVQGVAWILLVERMAGRRIPKLPALSVYLASQLARYTPGKVGLPLVRMDGASRLGLRRGMVGASVFIESLSWIATGGILGFALLSFAPPGEGLGRIVGQLSAPFLVLSLLGGAILLGVDRSRYPALLKKLLAPDGSGPLVPFRLPLVQLVYWGLTAVHGYLLTLALGAEVHAALPAMGFYVIAPVAGFIVLAAPAGLGVREAMLLAGLSPMIGSAAALGAAAISRAASLVAEVLTWLIVRMLARRFGATVDGTPQR
jgi:uncharacterized membrane protein YbhN (UPF0104 family)